MAELTHIFNRRLIYLKAPPLPQITVFCDHANPKFALSVMSYWNTDHTPHKRHRFFYFHRLKETRLKESNDRPVMKKLPGH